MTSAGLTTYITDEGDRIFTMRYGPAHGCANMAWTAGLGCEPVDRFRWITTILNAVVQNLNQAWAVEVDDDDRNAMVLILSDGERVADFPVTIHRRLLTITSGATGARVATARLSGPGRAILRAIASVPGRFFSDREED